MRGFYSEIGIALGEITYDDATAPMMISALGGPNSDLHQMFAQNTYRTGLAFFFVEELTSPLGGALTVGGLAGGTPGPTLQPGTSRSGVAVSTSSVENAEQLGHVMGHEGGHFLGLFHTQEIFGTTDQIDDTPEGMDDMSNLMFPTVTDQDASLSPGQGFVLLRNASVVTQ